MQHLSAKYMPECLPTYLFNNNYLKYILIFFDFRKENDMVSIDSFSLQNSSTTVDYFNSPSTSIANSNVFY